ncbi:MAG: lasso peptide biosynthesis B2 protein [Pseudonocardiaceae bacterium]
MAILLLCRWRGQRVVWRVGVHSPLPSSHAWIEADGQPIGEPFDPHRLYTPFITI